MMNNLAELEFVLLALATAVYAIATAVYWTSVCAGRGMQEPWTSRIALGGLLIQLFWFGIRTYQSGHLPAYNGHEFSVTLSGGIVLAVLIFERLSQRRDLVAFALPVVLLLLAYAWTLPRSVGPLVPVFKSLWLKTHIISSIMAYSAFATTFAASCLYLFKARSTEGDTAQTLAHLDRVAYQAAIIGFPFMTFCVISGAIWADYVWGRYWSWDPKETWSLITWLIFAAYLHTRYSRGWRQQKAAILAIVGFLTVLMTFIGVEIIYQYQMTTFSPLINK
jgi:cytochrome c-type biogenesis protein CcsB